MYKTYFRKFGHIYYMVDELLACLQLSRVQLSIDIIYALAKFCQCHNNNPHSNFIHNSVAQNKFSRGVSLFGKFTACKNNPLYGR